MTFLCRKKKFVISLLAFLILCLNQFVYAKDTTSIESNLTLKDLIHHLKVFQSHADGNTDIPGTRFMGTSGYNASRDYVVRTLKSAGYDVHLQSVPVTLSYISKPRMVEEVEPNARTFNDDTDYAPFIGSGGGDVIAPLSLAQSGCEQSEFSSFTKGSIALVTLGKCETATKITNAIDAGAKAIIIANNKPGIYYIGFHPTPNPNIPSLIISSDVAKTFEASIRHGKPPILHIKFHAKEMETHSENIIAESKTGNANHIVMVGAHLDSSAGNAGMNDNASAAATVLHSALLMKDRAPVNKLRFAFWTGEEIGMIGSTYYVTHLTPEEKSKIALYLNYEILGAPNGARLIMGSKAGVTPKGSEEIAQTYEAYFKAHQLKYLVFDPSMADAGKRSDMLAFMEAGIPVGYLVSGANIDWNFILSNVFVDLPNRKNGVAMHPCYHKLCDNLTLSNDQLSDPNFDFDLYLQLSKAAAHTIYTYAMREVQ